jgi:hypothetical protein
LERLEAQQVAIVDRAERRRGVVSAVACLLVALVAMAVLWGPVAMDQVGEWLAAAGTAPWEVQVAVGLTAAVVLMVAAVLVSRPR